MLLALVLSLMTLDALAQQYIPPHEIDPRLGGYQPAPVLRWQRPDGDTSRYGSPFGIHRAGYGPGNGSGVAFAAGDPFGDPFGDRLAQENGQPAPMPLNPPMPAPAPAAPEALAPPPSSAAPMPPMLDFGTPAPTAPSPSNNVPPEGDFEPPCDRVYNERNCCQDAERCEEVREFLRRLRITDISVDITPAFRPETGAFYAEDETDDEADEVEKSRAAQLALAGPRTWRNRYGEVVAEGRWTDFRYGRVYISTGDGDVVQIPVHELSDDDLCFVNAWWNLPSECTLGSDPFLGRHFVHTTFTWKASALCHKPLYFEELALERYGHTSGPVLQPIYSGAHFFSSIFFLPYKMGINPPNECIYPLGLYRPGSCAPWLAEPFPISLRGAALQTGAVLGGVYLLP
ncbi:MAG: hypothetical protein KY475_24455 [Planctomycetes bacterium]|nr:hypothetical protein [Planctomycetota bacterium]